MCRLKADSHSNSNSTCWLTCRTWRSMPCIQDRISSRRETPWRKPRRRSLSQPRLGLWKYEDSINTLLTPGRGWYLLCDEGNWVKLWGSLWLSYPSFALPNNALLAIYDTSPVTHNDSRSLSSEAETKKRDLNTRKFKNFSHYEYGDSSVAASWRKFLSCQFNISRVLLHLWG